MDTEAKYTVQEAAEKLGLKGSSVRWYCNGGMIPHVRRNSQGYRVLKPWQLNLLQTLVGMKQAGFATKDIRKYSRLFRKGPSTEAERIAILTTRKHQLQKEISERAQAIDFIERQEEIFAQSHSEA